MAPGTLVSYLVSRAAPLTRRTTASMLISPMVWWLCVGPMDATCFVVLRGRAEPVLSLTSHSPGIRQIDPQTTEDRVALGESNPRARTLLIVRSNVPNWRLEAQARCESGDPALLRQISYSCYFSNTARNTGTLADLASNETLFRADRGTLQSGSLFRIDYSLKPPHPTTGTICAVVRYQVTGRP